MSKQSKQLEMETFTSHRAVAACLQKRDVPRGTVCLGPPWLAVA